MEITGKDVIYWFIMAGLLLASFYLVVAILHIGMKIILFIHNVLAKK